METFERVLPGLGAAGRPSASGYTRVPRGRRPAPLALTLRRRRAWRRCSARLPGGAPLRRVVPRTAQHSTGAEESGPRKERAPESIMLRTVMARPSTPMAAEAGAQAVSAARSYMGGGGCGRGPLRRAARTERQASVATRRPPTCKAQPSHYPAHWHEKAEQLTSSADRIRRGGLGRPPPARHSAPRPGSPTAPPAPQSSPDLRRPNTRSGPRMNHREQGVTPVARAFRDASSSKPAEGHAEPTSQKVLWPQPFLL